MKAPMAFFSLVDNSRLWFKSRLGSDAEEVSRECSFCGYSAENDEILIVKDAQKDSRFAASPLVSGPPYVRFCVGVPIHAENGHALGTLCILDARRREIRPEELRVLRSLARAMETQLEIRQMLVEQQDLFEERSVLTDMIMHDASGVLSRAFVTGRIPELSCDRLPRYHQRPLSLVLLFGWSTRRMVTGLYFPIERLERLYRGARCVAGTGDLLAVADARRCKR